MKYVIITGGVLSGLGKGIVVSSLGKLLDSRGYSVCPVKFDGYLNVDAGTMNPFRHGEVFVLDDGTECDMDLGNYERFTGNTMEYANNPTGGKIFGKVIDKEREGKYLGKDVQFIPHVTGEIKDWVEDIGEKQNAEVVIIEVGGTVGDIENSYFIEAMRELHQDKEEGEVLFVHVTLVPILDVVGEQKTKPTQRSTERLLGMGVQPDFVVGRCEEGLNKKVKEKISLFCNVPVDHVISDPDCESIYKVPFLLEEENFSKKVLEELGLPNRPKSMERWKGLVDNMLNPEEKIKIAITGKYTELKDSYVSIIESLEHAGAHLDLGVELAWVETTRIEQGETTVEEELEDVKGVIVPGGFGSRGTEGKIDCIQHCRENDIPFLGLCYGFQMAVVEYARNVCGMENAHSTEIRDEPEHNVIDILPEQEGVKGLGGTMRLGGQDIYLKDGTYVQSIYNGKNKVRERFRHRYEVNPKYIEEIEKNGLFFSGTDKSGKIMQFLEIQDHPYFVATQAHPEFRSKLEEPAPVFKEFLKKAVKQ